MERPFGHFVLFSFLVMASPAQANLSVQESGEGQNPVLPSSLTHNLTTSPLIFLRGGLSAHFEINARSNLTLGPSFTYIDLEQKNPLEDLTLGKEVNAFGFATHYYFAPESHQDAWFVSAGSQIMRIRLKAPDSFGRSHMDGLLHQVGGGYQWHWEHFNLKLGATWMKLAGFKKRDQIRLATTSAPDLRLETGFSF